MYALLRGIDSLSSGTRVIPLSNPTVNPVLVRTEAPIPRMQHRAWFDANGAQHHEAIQIGASYVELETSLDNLVVLRRRHD